MFKINIVIDFTLFFIFIRKHSRKFIFLLIISLLLIFLIYWRKQHSHNILTHNLLFYNKFPINAKEMIELTDNKIHPYGKIGNQYRFTYHLFIYIFDWKYHYGLIKNVFIKGRGENACPGLYLSPEINNGFIIIHTEQGNIKFIINDIEINKWVHIGICVRELEVDIYYNGLIQSNNVLPALCKINNDPIVIASDHGFNGLIYKFGYSHKSYTPKQMRKVSKSSVITNSKYFI